MTFLIIDAKPIREPIPYDFNAGDVRKVNREEAIALAVERTHTRGARQSVRTSSAPDFVGTFWLVQDVR